MNNEGVDYVIDTKSESEWQKCLNQWKHKYNIEVISVIKDQRVFSSQTIAPYYPFKDRDITIVVKRTEM